ncbi:MAG: CinA family nicotinamide mononucleotide deamidase-related protein [Prevotellaceae bacterium]|jgi:nicotinamide-nucleotide amidase|nr:CinA family nicotinamide mononucleotide deamidase-related protein [Prevotellaceae bacterium]
MNAEIITIGDEILIGQIVDTNSVYIAEQLNLIGINVYQKTAISDNRRHIIESIDRAFVTSDILMVTGGLGPTNDDITKQVLAEYFGAGCMKIHEPSLEIVKNLIQRLNITLSETNIRQAELPDCCIPILNKNGTAPAMWFNRNGKILVAMPGVPFEMKAIMNDVIPMICKHFKLKSIYHKTLLTYGIPESVLSEKISEWENNLPKHLHLAYLPNPESGVRLRISAYNGESKQTLEQEVDAQFATLRTILKTAVYGENNDNLATATGKLLQQKGAMLATAESCTGGHIADMICSNSGASKCFVGSVVAYSNNIKIKTLGVNATDIEMYGAVSEQVVRQMAQGVCKALNADYAIATSGIAGPDGGTAEKPVGTVWIAVATPKRVIAQKYILSKLRDVNISRASAIALNMLRLELIEEKD